MTAALDDFSLLVNIRTPEDLYRRPRYEARIDAQNSKLAEVLTPYNFPQRYPCGLSSCRTPHRAGYLVVTDDGRETNIGWKCGKNIFGDEFAIKANLQEKRARLKYQLDTLQAVRDQKAAYLSRIADLLNRPTGAKWAESTLHDFKDIVGNKTAGILYKKARRNDTAVEVDRKATKQESDRNRVMHPGAKPLLYIREKLGDIVGLAFLNVDLVRVLTALKDRIYELDGVDAKLLSQHDRKQWVNWAESIERLFDEAETGLAEALRFFCQANLDLVASLIETDKDRPRARWNNSEHRYVKK